MSVYFRIFLVAAVLYFVPRVALGKTPDAQVKVEQEPQRPEEITHKQSLAVHMGLTQTEVVFGKPRNFRSESLNNFSLEPLTDDEN